VPIYLPLYIANFKTDDREFTLALAASEDEVRFPTAGERVSLHG
jgi:hypothetical protein